jgi:ferredoxin
MLPHELAREIITVNRDIPLRDLEQIIPYPTARKLVLHGPPDILLSECPCRSFRENPCQPTQVCMIIGQPFVDFKMEHSPGTSRIVSQQEALQLLEEEHKRGHFHSAWFRDVTLDRFIAICNCCKCCCAGVEGMTRYGSNFISSSGYVISIDETACTACGLCEQTCAFGAISVDGDMAKADWEKCLGCGACATQCPNDALSLLRDERKGIPMDVRMIT